MATSAQLRREILAGQWDEALCTLYGTEPAVPAPPPAGGGGRDGGNARSLRGPPHGDRPIQPVPRVRAPMGLDMGSGGYVAWKVRERERPRPTGRGLWKAG